MPVTDKGVLGRMYDPWSFERWIKFGLGLNGWSMMLMLAESSELSAILFIARIFDGLRTSATAVSRQEPCSCVFHSPQPLISCRRTVRRLSALRPCQPWSWLSRLPFWTTSSSEAFPMSECYRHSSRPTLGRNNPLRVDIIPKADECAEGWALVLK